MPETATKKVLIVGAGPVGSLTALTFHKRGWNVEVWEGREDPRGADMSPANLRSINLAISSRGLEALKSVDPSLAEELLGQAIPMKGRMIHHNDGRQESQLYDPSTGQCINSLPRPLLNLRLIQALPTDSERMKLRFETKLDRIDWRRNIAYARPKKGGKPGEEREQGEQEEQREGRQDSDAVEFDLIVGCDGSWSKVRQEMMKVERIDFSQSFIQHAYIELHMPPNEMSKENQNADAKFKIDQHHLHIWPRHSFMLIGLPNQDGSFTLTLFAPFASIESLQTREQAEEFFQEHFPTALEWVGKDKLIDDFMKNPRGKLVTINASPSHHDSKAILLGDASHSMVPFYGQGLNCGLEDVRVLGCMLQKHAVSSVKTGQVNDDVALSRALSEYSEIRGKDLEAICELAMENYTEMRSHVLTPMHHLRRIIDSCLSRLFRPTPYTPLSSSSTTSSLSSNTVAFPTPHVSGWSSLYSMVTFRPDVSYREALRKERVQREVVAWMGRGLVGAALAGVGLGGYKALQWWSRRR